MAKFARFDARMPAPHPVIGWYDCDRLRYKMLPPVAEMIEITEEQWAARMRDPSAWVVDNGALRMRTEGDVL